MTSSIPEGSRDRLQLHRLGYTGPLLDTAVTHWDGERWTERHEQVVEEVPIAIAYNGIPHVVMMGTPTDLEDFTLGFSLTEDLIGTADDLMDLEIMRYSKGIEIHATVADRCGAAIAERTRRLTGRTGCGICGADSVDAVLKQIHPVRRHGTVAIEAIQRAFEALTARQALNAAAGAVHAAGWARLDGELVFVREDVGRHNALDKLVGAVKTAKIDSSEGFAVATSRASFEMVQKATVLDVPLLAAISGPTALAIRVAQQAGLTLVGFARGRRLNVYTYPELLHPGADDSATRRSAGSETASR